MAVMISSLGRRVARTPASIMLVIAIVAIIVLMALLAPWVAPVDPDHQSLLARLKGPGTSYGGTTYWFGTDKLGRDIYGARVSLAVAVLSVAVSTVVGVTLGMLAGWFRGITETIIMRLVDIMMSIPAILLAVLTVAVLGPGFTKLVLVLGLTRWPRYTRVAFGQTLQVANMPFVKASDLAGAGVVRILSRHILPNIAGPIMIVATAEFGLMILFEASLSFLGLGIQPPAASWGSIMSVGRQYLEQAWWITAFPGIFLFLLVFSVNVLGDWLRDQLDPRSRSR